MAGRTFRVELMWHDSVNDKDEIYAIYHDFPDASRASAFATAFIPEGEALEPNLAQGEIARTERATVKLWEVP